MLDSSVVIQIISIIILLVFSAYFSSAETALTTCNKIRMRSLAEEGNKRARIVLAILEHQGKMLSAILIGNNIVNISASSISTVLATNLFGNGGAGIATGILTMVVLVFGEISPKTIATIHADNIALAYASSIRMFMFVFTPIIYIINNISKVFLRIFGVDMNQKNKRITESELRTIVDVSHEEGVIESEERKMINNVVDFGDSQAKDIMVPRVDMSFVNINATYEELLALFEKDRYTRLPVYEDSIDNITGIINMKDLLLYRNGEDFSIRNYLRDVHFTYEYKRTSELLIEMRETSSTLTIVLDEYGSVAGLITVEDLLEEIVGEIRDEYDNDEEDLVQRISDDEYIISASIRITDLNELLDLEIEQGDYDSLGGFVIEQLDHLPEKGEEVAYNDMVFCVESVEKNRIETIRLIKKPTEQQNDN